MEAIKKGEIVLGIEFGSTRIKAVLTDLNANLLETGIFDWENTLQDGLWTYSIDEIITGMQNCYANLCQKVKTTYNVEITNIASIGISAMMHGYMAFDKSDTLLVPFRTWRNTNTAKSAAILTDLFQYNIPQRWSIAHLYQAILDKEPHVSSIDFVTTLAGFIHYKLTGQKVLGIGDASGMFPIDANTKNFDQQMIDKFNNLCENLKLENIFPKVLLAGQSAGVLTADGANLLDISGKLQAGCILCPPEGDAGTGMVATNSVKKKTGNVSAGTSIFAMIVLENNLKSLHEEIDMVTTPCGSMVAMVHCNNCTSDLNAWVNLFRDFWQTMGQPVDMDLLFGTLYRSALEGATDCGKLMSYNYFSGEPITGLESGRSLFVRGENADFSLSNFMRCHLYSSVATLKIGMDILTCQENVTVENLIGHGGLFKTPLVGQQIMADALNTTVSVNQNASEGGAWGIAVLALFALQSQKITLADYLEQTIFNDNKNIECKPNATSVKGFEKFIEQYKKGLPIEHLAVKLID